MKKRCGLSAIEKTRGSFEGAIRIPLRALSFLFNDLAFPGLPANSLKFLTSLLSLPPLANFLIANALLMLLAPIRR